MPVAALIVFLGVNPKPALDRIEPAVEAILERIDDVEGYEVPDFARTDQLDIAGGGV